MPRRKTKPTDQLELGFEAPETITFRLLDDNLRQVLGERAKRMRLSPHELARVYVAEALAQAEERAALRAAVKTLRDELNKLRADFAFAVCALLTSAGTVSEEKAKAWVEESLNSP